MTDIYRKQYEMTPVTVYFSEIKNSDNDNVVSSSVIIVSNMAAMVVIIGVISIVLVVLYRKGKLHCLHRTAR